MEQLNMQISYRMSQATSLRGEGSAEGHHLSLIHTTSSAVGHNLHVYRRRSSRSWVVFKWAFKDIQAQSKLTIRTMNVLASFVILLFAVCGSQNVNSVGKDRNRLNGKHLRVSAGHVSKTFSKLEAQLNQKNVT